MKTRETASVGYRLALEAHRAAVDPSHHRPAAPDDGAPSRIPADALEAFADYRAQARETASAVLQRGDQQVASCGDQGPPYTGGFLGVQPARRRPCPQELRRGDPRDQGGEGLAAFSTRTDALSSRPAG
ncbi:hypothetical protein SNE510_63230 [Streptomyces sp. NE5-10]|nr:hypothetical protein SNE510_63230 [Streptomyces sp. NE5-10]